MASKIIPTPLSKKSLNKQVIKVHKAGIQDILNFELARFICMRLKSRGSNPNEPCIKPMAGFNYDTLNMLRTFQPSGNKRWRATGLIYSITLKGST